VPIERDVLATCVLPWNERFQLDEAAFVTHLELLAAEMTRHVYIFGTAGEGYAVTDAQFHQIAALFQATAARVGIEPMLGAVSTSLGTVVERIEYGLDLGVREFQLSFPSWGAVTDAERDAFFAATCGRFPDARFLHYNTPRGGRVLTGGEYAVLADRHPNLVALKFSSRDADAVRELVSACAPVRCYLTEYAFAIAHELHPSADVGLLVSLSGVRTDLPRRFAAARRDELVELVTTFGKVHDLLLSCAPQAHMDGAFEKLIARAHGAKLPLRLLPPYQSATEEQAETFLTGLEAILP
jgi:dihydrodipicolinate synthase/N-acetylneuraminate lyase